MVAGQDDQYENFLDGHALLLNGHALLLDGQ